MTRTHRWRIGLVAAGVVLGGPLSASGQERSVDELKAEVDALSLQRQFSEAIPVAEEAVKAAERAFGPDDPHVAASLNDLANLYRAQAGKAQETYLEAAPPLYERALAICERTLGANDPTTAFLLNNLAEAYKTQGRYAEAEPLYLRALESLQASLGNEHPMVNQLLENMLDLQRLDAAHAPHPPRVAAGTVISSAEAAAVGHGTDGAAQSTSAKGATGKGEGLEASYQWKLAAMEETLGPDHPAVVSILNDLAELYRADARYAQAEPLYQRMLAIDEKTHGPRHETVAMDLNNLAEVYRLQGRCAEAEPLYQRVVGLLEELLGPEHPDVSRVLEQYALCLDATGKPQEAQAARSRAKKLSAR